MFYFPKARLVANRAGLEAEVDHFIYLNGSRSFNRYRVKTTFDISCLLKKIVKNAGKDFLKAIVECCTSTKHKTTKEISCQANVRFPCGEVVSEN